MRQGANHRRSRGRSNNRKSFAPSRSQTFDSNGPDVRIRGNAYQVFEKYLSLARDASASGDRINAENYFQHAEHYFRILNGDGTNGQAQGAARGQRLYNGNLNEDEFEGDGDSDGDTEEQAEASARDSQPEVAVEQKQPVASGESGQSDESGKSDEGAAKASSPRSPRGRPAARTRDNAREKAGTPAPADGETPAPPRRRGGRRRTANAGTGTDSVTETVNAGEPV